MRWHDQEPEAVRAIHDAIYATPPAGWEQYLWRLQHIAEEHIGRRVREAQSAEDAAFRNLNDAG